MALPSAVAAIAPPLIAGVSSLMGQERANQRNIQLAREQMAFQERMSGTSWQRAVADMKLAGINPMLAYQQGGASSPSGQTARVEDVIGPAVSSAMSLMRMRKELKLLDAQAYRTREEGHHARVQRQVLDYGDNLAAPGSPWPVNLPYRAQQNKARLELLKKQIGLTDAQMRALRMSPFVTRFLGIDFPSNLKTEVFQGRPRLKYERRFK